MKDTSYVAFYTYITVLLPDQFQHACPLIKVISASKKFSSCKKIYFPQLVDVRVKFQNFR